MIYLTLDTCVWLEILKTEWNSEYNLFEEICFWLENHYLIHITTENMVREWDRNKVSKTEEIIKQVKSINKGLVQPFRINSNVNSIYEPDSIRELILKRIERLDHILKNISELAKEKSKIYTEAAQRNLKCLAPNHKQDSFRDTVNILTLIHYIKEKKYSECYFSTINGSDFSNPESNHDLHPDLITDFKSINLQYAFYHVEPTGNKLINVFLRPKLPNFQNFLEEKKLQTKLEENKVVTADTQEILDVDFLENIKFIDEITSRSNPTTFQTDALTMLMNRHESYKNYFLNKIGNNGVV